MTNQLAINLEALRKAHWAHWSPEENTLVLWCVAALADMADVPDSRTTRLEAIAAAAKTYYEGYAQDEADSNAVEWTGCSEDQHRDAAALREALDDLDARES